MQNTPLGLDQMQAHTNDTFSDAHNYVDAASTFAGSYGAADDNTILMQGFNNEAALNQDLRNFFEQIMVSEFDAMATEFIQPPPDLTAWMDEVEYFGQLDLFGANFMPNMDQIFDPQVAQEQINPVPVSVDGNSVPSPNRRFRDSPQRGHAALPRSPLYVYISKDCIALLTRPKDHGFLHNISMPSVSRRTQLLMVKIST